MSIYTRTTRGTLADYGTRRDQAEYEAYRAAYYAQQEENIRQQLETLAAWARN